MTQLVTVKHVDITTLNVDVIVNAANEQLLRGGGVCGAIFKKSGPELDEYCERQPLVDGIRCATGYSIMTPSFGITNVKHIIHAVGPIYKDGKSGEAELLKRAYVNAVEMAVAHKLNSIAFPFISSGIYGYPVIDCALIAMKTLHELSHKYPIEITMTAYSANDYMILSEALTLTASIYPLCQPCNP